ncbi:MAG: hypothetical protein PF541_12190, partial [Prolixibacteraceae bacterium]|nr:hypothetical protein [Prolixibacteraceae bacterium]
MKLIIQIFLLCIPFLIHAQNDSTYYFGANGKIVIDEHGEQKCDVTFKLGHKLKVTVYTLQQDEWSV